MSYSPENTSELSLAQRGLRGAAWIYGGSAVVIVGQLAYTAMTARLISPSEFGAYATAQALLMLVGYFALSSVGNALIRHPALDRRVVGTALVITGVAGAIVALVVLAVAGLWADLWRAPDAASLVRILAPQVLLASLAVVPVSLIRRNLRYGAASLIETASALAGFTVGAVLAVSLRSAEALVAGQVATSGALLTLGVLVARAELGLTWDREHARSLFSFSAQVSLQNLGHYFNNTLPSLVVSRSLGQSSLGYFSRASLLVGLPLSFLAQGAAKTLYPMYPKFRENVAESRKMMLDVTCVGTYVVWPLFGALAGLAPVVVEVLLGDEWTPVVELVGPLSVYAAANFAYSIYASFAEAFGYLRQIWVVQVCWTLVLALLLILAVAEDADMRTIVVVAAAVQLAVHALQVVLLGRLGTIDVRGTLRTEAGAALLALVWFAATFVTARLTADQGLAPELIACFGAIVALTAMTWYAFPHMPAGKALARRGIALSRIGSIRGLRRPR
jgi:O-antigen/teichoic acid export membrane protein